MRLGYLLNGGTAPIKLKDRKLVEWLVCTCVLQVVGELFIEQIIFSFLEKIRQKP